MLSLNAFDLLFEFGSLLGLDKLLRLLLDDTVGLTEQLLDLFLVTSAKRGCDDAVLLVLGVQLEDDLGQLGDLLRHFMVSLLGDLGCLGH